MACVGGCPIGLLLYWNTLIRPSRRGRRSRRQPAGARTLVRALALRAIACRVQQAELAAHFSGGGGIPVFGNSAHFSPLSPFFPTGRREPDCPYRRFPVSRPARGKGSSRNPLSILNVRCSRNSSGIPHRERNFGTGRLNIARTAGSPAVHVRTRRKLFSDAPKARYPPEQG